MSVNALLSTIVLVAFIVTVVLAVGSYMAYKIRERKRAPSILTSVDGEPVFFERVYPGATGRTRPAGEPASDTTGVGA